MAKKYIHSVGKRKSSIARIWMEPGKGTITVNKRPIDDYYIRATSKMIINQPLELTENVDKYDIKINVCGGGLNGQAGAIRHAISKALSDIDPEFRIILKAKGLITRDSRTKERKLPGLKGARAKYQFSKR
jgi:small subunit ribosomal protein S9